MPGGAQRDRELPIDIFFLKFTLCQGSNAGGSGGGGEECQGNSGGGRGGRGGYFFLWDICILIFLMTTCSARPGAGAVVSPRLVWGRPSPTLMPSGPFPTQGICSQRRAARRDPIP